MDHSTDLRDCLYELDRVHGLLTRTRREMDRARDQQRQFAANAGHELRTPLAGLRVELEEARMNPGLTRLPELLDRALRDVDRIQDIVTDLLLLVRLEAGATTERRHVDLAGLVGDVVGRRGDEKPVTLRLTAAVTADIVPHLIERALDSLLDNAQRHAAGSVEVWLRRDGGNAEVAVTDDGAGIPVRDWKSIFDVFARLDTARDRGDGAGLGLALSRSIALAHGGDLVLDPSHAGGARFVLRLPAA
ncbi:sensor histidine kinase [Sphaerisporangium aureirubrum]|uniref:histidine kinase n=1 Tax=Sphaerisporangium aureirubrum TaxID=1544736 RepID=A0ABW1NHY8_9ACTN